MSKDRARKREQRGVYDPDRMAWMRTLPCLLWDDPIHVCRPGTVVGHHVRSVGAGGTDDDMVPLCVLAHREVHDIGRETFEAKHDVDLEELAAKYARLWRERAD